MKISTETLFHVYLVLAGAILVFTIVAAVTIVQVT